MVIISVALCTRGGKPILARQFIEITRMRLEALLTSFPKLVSPTKQHTYVESDTVRYVFQPMENLFLLMITTKNSNIVEDLDTLRLLSKVVADACPQVTEENVIESSFELVAAFDEVISLGYRETISLAGIRANLEMNSHEEKLSQMIRQSKEMEAKQEMKRKSMLIKAQKQQDMAGGGGGKMEGFGSSSASYVPSTIPTANYQASASVGASTKTTTSTSTEKPKATSKPGLKFGKKSKDVAEAMAVEDGIDPEEFGSIKLSASSNTAAPGSVAVPKDPVTVLIQENVSATIQQDGSLSNYAVSGQIQILSRQEDAKFSVQFTQPASSLFQFKPHPQLDKTKWDKNALIQLKQTDRAIPAGAPFGALRYRSNKVDDVADIPLAITVWPEVIPGGATNVNLEVELHGDVELHDITIVVPLGSQEAPEVKNCSIGTHRHNSRRQQLEWVIDSLSPENPSGAFEFDLAKSEPSLFFPTVGTFKANKSLAGLVVQSVTNLVDGSPIRFSTETAVTTDAYEVIADE